MYEIGTPLAEADWECVYLLEYANGREYCGIAVNGARRWLRHCDAARGESDNRKYRAWRKQERDGHGGPVARVFDVPPETVRAWGKEYVKAWLCLREIRVIADRKLYLGLGRACRGYNATTGGEAGWELAEESRAKMRGPRPAMRDEARAKISAKLKGRDYRREWAESLGEGRRCRKCAAVLPADCGKRTCGRCRAEANEAAKLRRAEKRKAGLCTRVSCREPVASGHTMCEKHLDAMRTKAREDRAKARARGLCRTCQTKPCEEGRQRCAECLARAAELEQRRRDEVRGSGLCYQCRSRPTEKGRPRCRRCMDMCKEAARKARRLAGATRPGKGKARRQAELRAERNDTIRELRAQGMHLKDIGQRVDLSEAGVSRVLSRNYPQLPRPPRQPRLGRTCSRE